MPNWITPAVNLDAMKMGTKEMTAVGRAVISRWVYDEIWGKCFHPGLDSPLREELKRIETNVRFFSPTATNLEDTEALTSKLVQWRLTTMEGLAYRLKSSAAQEATANFVQLCVGNLTAHLLQHLSESAAMNVQGNATSIVELAVGIAQHIPLESRDIVISYPMPHDAIQSFMKVEPALPPLESYFAIPDSTGDENGGSSKEEVKDVKDVKGKKLEKTKGGKKAPEGSASAPTQEQLQEVERKRAEAKERIRFAGFVGVEVRGRQALYQPPVWTIA